MGDGRRLAPSEVGPGYWPTICLYWPARSPCPLGIEIFPDRIEVYQLQMGRNFSVAEHPVSSGEVLPPLLVQELDLLIPERSPCDRA